MAYGKSTFPENDDVHIEGLQIRLGVRILVEGSETDERVVPEQLNLLAGLFEQDILCCQGVDAKDLLAGNQLPPSP